MDIKAIKQRLLEREKLKADIMIGERLRVHEALKENIPLMKRCGIKRAYLYGTIVRGAFNRSSDVDVAVEPALPYGELLRLHSSLSIKLGRTVDIRILDELPFREHIRREGTLLYERKDRSS
ncbi:MAG TPA: nucleotidyltransferase domain-containing protein [Spirochaetota bacterium]|nr:nucleotidyltransferase domain-containing protein [Spirochaetota bacterium]